MSDLQQVVALIKAGEKVQARKQLLAILAEDRNNEKAWVYMALCAANREELVASVRHALRVNPQSAAALKLADQHHIAIVPAKSTPAAHKPSASPKIEPEVADDPYPTQEAHPTQLLPPRKPSTKVRVDVKSEFAMPDWAGDTPKPPKKSKGRGKIVVLGLLGLVVVAVGLAAIVMLTSGDAPLGANAQTATSISGTNAVIMDSQQQLATNIALTLNPPTPTRIPRENAQP
ncbi:MAG: hypothetical protein HY862_05295 [Chloroflexi bacterium]|nr:hypothetical protein [Chloroflexota bacterium]